MASVYITSIADCWLDLTFIVDSSGSINQNEWKQSLEFVADVVNNFTIGPDDVQVAFVRFSSTATVQWGLTKYQNEKDLTDAINNVQYSGGGTNLNNALHLTRTVVYGPGGGARDGALRATIILTDGVYIQPVQTLHTANLCKNDSIRLITVGVSDGVNVDQLKEISSPSDYYPVGNFNSLPTIVDDLKSKICPNMST